MIYISRFTLVGLFVEVVFFNTGEALVDGGASGGTVQGGVFTTLVLVKEVSGGTFDTSIGVIVFSTLSDFGFTFSILRG